METLARRMKDMELFGKIKEDELSSMLECLGAACRTYEKGAFIFLEGENLNSVGVVLEGAVQMVKEDAWGQKSILLTLGPGELFGESFVCGQQAGSIVSFLTASGCQVLLMDFHRVLRACSASCVFHHRLIENMVTLLAKKNVQLMEKMEILSQKTLRERILVWLSQQAQKNGSDRFDSPMGRLELADYLCADRSALTRELTRMKRDGLLDYKKNRFTLRRRDAPRKG